MVQMEQLWSSLRAIADECAEIGSLVSMADAKYYVLALCQKANADPPSPASLEYYASELVQLTLEAHEARRSRLRLHQVG
jgi:hypothetical protein